MVLSYYVGGAMVQRCDFCLRLLSDCDVWNGRSVCKDCQREADEDIEEMYVDVGGEGGE